MLLAQAFAPLVDLIYPPRCPLCGEAIAQQKGLCTPCWSSLTIPTQPQCRTCQRPFGEEAALSERTCMHCHKAPPLHDGIAAGTLYTQPARQLVLAFKHGGKIALAEMMAGMIAARLGTLEGEWVAIPVPLHPWRLWQRGFNQSALLARHLAVKRGLTLMVDGLRRTKRTPPLAGLGAAERRKSLANAIAVTPKRQSAIYGARILLVDDVLTSGATTNACVTALKGAGAVEVRIACFSRVLDEW